MPLKVIGNGSIRQAPLNPLYVQVFFVLSRPTDVFHHHVYLALQFGVTSVDVLSRSVMPLN